MNMQRFVILIDSDRCKGCGLCVDYCPRAVLEPSKRINRLGYHPVEAAHPEKCTGCQACVVMCPDAAIELFRRRAKSKEAKNS
jgi:2-oxoglutarate ferredoxin oxidoreductase subunit delta